MPRQPKLAPVPDYDFDADIATPAADIAAMYAEGRDYAAQEQAREDEARRAYERAETMAAQRDYSQTKRDFKEWLTATGTDIVDFIHDAGEPLHSQTAERYAAMAGYHQITWSNNVTRRAKDAARSFKRGSKMARQATIMQAQAAPAGDYLDSSVEGTEPLEPYMPQKALLARLTRYAQNAVAVVAFGVVPVLALAGCIYRSAVERQGTPEPLLQATPTTLIEARAVSNYAAPVKFTKGDASWKPEKSQLKSSSNSSPTMISTPRFCAVTTSPPCRPSSRSAAGRKHSRKSGSFKASWRRVRALSCRTAKPTPRHKSARYGPTAAQQHRYTHHTHRSVKAAQKVRIQRATPAVVGGAYFAAWRFENLEVLE